MARSQRLLSWSASSTGSPSGVSRASRRASVSSSSASSPVTSGSPGSSAASARASLIAWSHRSPRMSASPRVVRCPSVNTRYTTRSTALSRSGRSAGPGTRNAIPAWRIFRLARTSRCAMVGSGTRKAAAISAVVSPHTARSVSPTRTAGSSAGWQQVKISASSSSVPATHPPNSCGEASLRTASASLSARRRSRRTRSSALCRAVPISQPRGLSGTPPAGHWAKAAAQASCTASSATSRSPTWRVTAATAAHQWARNTSASAPLSGWLLSGSHHLDHGPHLHLADLRHGEGRRPLQRLVQVRAFDQGVTAEVLLDLGRRAIGEQNLSVPDAHRGRRGRGLQRRAIEQHARARHGAGGRSPFGPHPLELLATGLGELLLRPPVQQEHVLHHAPPLLAGQNAGYGMESNGAAPDRHHWNAPPRPATGRLEECP